MGLRRLRLDISIHAPREGCDRFTPQGHPGGVISIHAPREGCDARQGGRQDGRRDISIHAPREGCDLMICGMDATRSISIHAPREGCDRGEHRRCVGGHNFNPRTPRGVRHWTCSLVSCSLNFNPRTPRGVRHQFIIAVEGRFIFQSTHPARGATFRVSCGWGA